MYRDILSINEAFAASFGDFDPATHTLPQLDWLLKQLSTIHKMTGSAIASVSAHVAQVGSKDQQAQRKRDLANISGSSPRDVDQQIAAGAAMASNPDVGEAARAGELSSAQLGVIASANAEDPQAASQLVKMAKTRSLRELQEESARLLAARTDAEARRKKTHAARALRAWTGPDGVWQLRANGTPDDGATVMAVISAIQSSHFEQARKAGHHESSEAYAFDALVDLATSGGGGPPPTEVCVRIDFDTLMRGYTLAGEICEVTGFGPTTPQAVVDLMDTGDPFLKAVVTRGKDVVGVVHLGRKPTAHQKTALNWVFPRCAAQGCSTTASWLQTDHREDWAKTRYTVFDLLDRLCPHHHRLKTHEGWRLIEGKGKRPFVPPHDPRHPGPGSTVTYRRGHRPQRDGPMSETSGPNRLPPEKTSSVAARGPS